MPFGLPDFVEIEDYLKQTDNPQLLILFHLFFRFSLISFCLITGFLIGAKPFVNNRSFFKSRIKNVIPPYLIAVIVTVFYLFLREIFKNGTASFFKLLYSNIFSTSFWYIPSNLLSLFILLPLVKRLPRLLLGGILFLLTAIVTYKFVYIDPIIHNNPIFFPAFAFYIWVGYIVAKQNLIAYINKTSSLLVFVIWVLSFGLLYFETNLLLSNGHRAILNNLKISNQLYALVSFVALVKISKFVKSIKIIDVRTGTYGIYLYNTLIGYFVAVLLHQITGSFNSESTILSILFTLFHFTVTFVATIIIVNFLLRHKLFYLGKR